MTPQTRLPGVHDRAREILQRFAQEAAHDNGSVSRNNILNELGGLGRANLDQRRQYAAAWQLLERAGIICPEARVDGDGVYFATTDLQRLLAGDLEGEISLRLGGGY